MNKKGFTLIELLVSMIILAIIMVFITTFLLNLSNQKNDAQLDLNLLVNQAAISKILNADANIYGIESVTCPSSKKCNVTFKSGESLTKTIEIVNSKKSIKYYDSNKVYMVRTLEGNREFDTISYAYRDFTDPAAKFHEITISFANNNDYNIKVYDYRLNISLFSVTINANGGVYTGGDIPSLPSGGTYDLNQLATPTKTGYTFTGWTTSSPASITGTTFTMGNANATITASWTPITYYIRYNANGGSGSMANSTHYYDTASNLTNNSFSSSGYTFTGWATSSTGASVYSNGASISNLSSTNGAIVDLYAKWSNNSYTLTYNNQSGSGCTTKSVTYGGQYGTLCTPTRTGYTFGGWYTGTGGSGIQIISTTTVTTASNHTIYAKWTGNTYTVTLSCNGGSGSQTTQSCTNGSTVSISRNVSECGYIVSSSMVSYPSGWSSNNFTCSGNTTVNANWSNLFSYSGVYTFDKQDSNNWVIRMTSSGYLNIYSNISTNVFLVGGGGGGGSHYSYIGGGGGGGGYTLNSNATFYAGYSYYLTVGSGGSAGNNSSGSQGGATIINLTQSEKLYVPGGFGGVMGNYAGSTYNTYPNGGPGGSGGGGGGKNSKNCAGGTGGSYGGNGSASYFDNTGGNGMGSNETCEFYDNTTHCYAGGGGGGAGYTSSSCPYIGSAASAGDSEIYGLGGNGGAGNATLSPTNGNSGIIVIRNAR